MRLARRLSRNLKNNIKKDIKENRSGGRELKLVSGPVARCCEHCDEYNGSVKDRVFPDQLRQYQLPKWALVHGIS